MPKGEKEVRFAQATERVLTLCPYEKDSLEAVIWFKGFIAGLDLGIEAINSIKVPRP